MINTDEGMLGLTKKEKNIVVIFRGNLMIFL